ncbi:hypothetical protein [Sphingomonas sp. 3-13AW]|uniref:Mom family adenine methylcarbamoylation protein n=1 Tax=Sphingomonas sp. 3-13AW TaxID=3050450 RepID=UPI003BB7319E
MKTDRSQRWRERREMFVPGDAEFDPSVHSVDAIDCWALAKPFVEQHHYSGSFPASRFSAGLFRNGPGGTSSLVGVCTFAQPSNNRSVAKTANLAHHTHAVDLGRLVLLDDVGCNGETFLVSRALRLLRQHKPEVVSVISYADPIKRRVLGSGFIHGGHIGRIYQIMDALYLGRASARTLDIMPNGLVFSPRALSKLRAGETGSEYALRQLLSAGADEMRADEDAEAWVQRLRARGFFTRIRHPGTHKYLFPLTRSAKIAAVPLVKYDYPQADLTQPYDVTALEIMRHAA